MFDVCGVCWALCCFCGVCVRIALVVSVFVVDVVVDVDGDACDDPDVGGDGCVAFVVLCLFVCLLACLCVCVCVCVCLFV